MRLEPPSWWYEGRIPPVAFGLLPISALYGALVQQRFRKAQPYRSKLPIICAGNFTMGGAGKTPVALKLCALLRERGRKPGFLTRGYGGAEAGPYLVDADADTAARTGDEPLLLAGVAPTVVSRNRPAGARLLETLNVDAIIMDDGFQNPSLKKDFNLVAVDAGAGLGSARVFPLGPLRAPLGFQAAMADAIVIIGRGRTGQASAALKLEWAASFKLPVFEAEIEAIIPESIRGGTFLAFCGIGRPAKFFATLQDAGISTAMNHSFPDHHSYTEADARSLIAEARALGAGLITTGKDHVRLKGAPGARGDLYRAALALPIALRFSTGDEKSLIEAIFSRI